MFRRWCEENAAKTEQFSAGGLAQSISMMALTGIERARETATTMLCKVPVLRALCRGTVIMCGGGPSCMSRIWLPFDGRLCSQESLVRGLDDLPRRLAAFSCRFDWN